MECPRCHAENRPDARFCGHCGEALALPDEMATSEATICPHCGSPVTSGAVFCGRCGTPVSSEFPSRSPSQPPHCGVGRKHPCREP